VRISNGIVTSAGCERPIHESAKTTPSGASRWASRGAVADGRITVNDNRRRDDPSLPALDAQYRRSDQQRAERDPTDRAASHRPRDRPSGEILPRVAVASGKHLASGDGAVADRLKHRQEQRSLQAKMTAEQRRGDPARAAMSSIPVAP